MTPRKYTLVDRLRNAKKAYDEDKEKRSDTRIRYAIARREVFDACAHEFPFEVNIRLQHVKEAIAYLKPLGLDETGEGDVLPSIDMITFYFKNANVAIEFALRYA